MAVEAVRHEILFLLRPAALVHFGVERGEEKVLQDGFVENGFLVAGLGRGKAVEDLRELALVKQHVGNESLLFDEPAEHEARDEADDADVILAVLLGRVLGKLDVVERPEIPVGDFEEEPLVEFGTVERLLPGGVERDEIGEVVLFAERVEGEVGQDFDVGAVRVGEADVFDERDLFEHVLRLRRACASGD